MPSTSEDEELLEVSPNKFGHCQHSLLRVAEYAVTEGKLTEIARRGRSGQFDVDQIKVILRFIFSEVHEWAGHMRDERPIVDGLSVEPIGKLKEGGARFLPRSRVAMGLQEALRQISDADALKRSTTA